MNRAAMFIYYRVITVCTVLRYWPIVWFWYKIKYGIALYDYTSYDTLRLAAS